MAFVVPRRPWRALLQGGRRLSLVRGLSVAAMFFAPAFFAPAFFVPATHAQPSPTTQRPTSQRPTTERGERFSRSELRQLAAGELVSRPVVRRRGQATLVGGTSFRVVERAPSVTWRALCDTSRYRAMLPSAQSADVVAHRPGMRVVRVRHSVGMVTATYHLRMNFDHSHHGISFQLDRQRPNDLRAAWGFLRVDEYDDNPNRSLLTWGVMADMGGGMVGSLFRGEVHDWMMRVPSLVRNDVHTRG